MGGYSLNQSDIALPSSIDAERTILGATLLDNSSFSEAAEVLTADDFSLDSHRRIFLRMTDLMMSQRAVDIVTLANELARYKEVESVGGVAYLASLTEGLPRRPVIAEYIRIVRDKSMARRAMSICSAAIARYADQSETALEVLEDLESQLIDVAQSAVTGTVRTIAESVELAGGVDQYMAPILNQEEMTGLKTGFLDFDAMTGGLKKGDFIVIAARPSMGKTSIGLNILENVCEDHDAVALFFSLEMNRSAIERRALASTARVDIQRALRGMYLSNTEKEKLLAALPWLVEANLYIDDSPVLTPTQMMAKARRLKQRCGRLDLILLDYVQMVNPGGKFENEQVATSHVSRSLKALAKQLDCPLLALAQLNRASEQRSDKRPVLSDLRQSGQIEQDADVVCLLHRDSYYDPNNEDVKGIADLIVAKQRNGATGIVKLAFVPELTRFDNLQHGYNRGTN